VLFSSSPIQARKSGTASADRTAREFRTTLVSPPSSVNRKTSFGERPCAPGKSSPVLTRRHIFLTAFEGGKLFPQCFDRQTGKLAWERFVERPRAESANALNHPAAITAVTDGENVYPFFKDYGLISYDPEGNVRWKAPLGPFSDSMGHSPCPVVAGDNVILVIDQIVDSYIAAFDRRNGEIRWKTPREEMEGWATPLLYQPASTAPAGVNGQPRPVGRSSRRQRQRSWRLPPSSCCHVSLFAHTGCP
jgi:outer membrane protein assembly factor BamB